MSISAIPRAILRRRENAAPGDVNGSCSSSRPRLIFLITPVTPTSVVDCTTTKAAGSSVNDSGGRNQERQRTPVV